MIETSQPDNTSIKRQMNQSASEAIEFPLEWRCSVYVYVVVYVYVYVCMCTSAHVLARAVRARKIDIHTRREPASAICSSAPTQISTTHRGYIRLKFVAHAWARETTDNTRRLAARWGKHILLYLPPRDHPPWLLNYGRGARSRMRAATSDKRPRTTVETSHPGYASSRLVAASPKTCGSALAT
jgi:hypothetical protein